jgi:hypothetical protein
LNWWHKNPADWPASILLFLVFVCVFPVIFFAAGEQNLIALLWAIAGMSISSIIGSWTGSGFPFFFDFCAMQVFLVSIGTILLVSWRWISLAMN